MHKFGGSTEKSILPTNVKENAATPLALTPVVPLRSEREARRRAKIPNGGPRCRCLYRDAEMWTRRAARLLFSCEIRCLCMCIICVCYCYCLFWMIRCLWLHACRVLLLQLHACMHAYFDPGSISPWHYSLCWLMLVPYYLYVYMYNIYIYIYTQCNLCCLIVCCDWCHLITYCRFMYIYIYIYIYLFIYLFVIIYVYTYACNDYITIRICSYYGSVVIVCRVLIYCVMFMYCCMCVLLVPCYVRTLHSIISVNILMIDITIIKY